MPETKYRLNSKYSSALIITDMFSKFMWGRSLIDDEENDQERVVYRLITEILSAFGVPEGYSTSYGTEVIERCMQQTSDLFKVSICCVAANVGIFLY